MHEGRGETSHWHMQFIVTFCVGRTTLITYQKDDAGRQTIVEYDMIVFVVFSSVR